MEKKLLTGAVLWKAAVLLVMAWAYRHLPFQVQNWNINFHFPPMAPPGPSAFLRTWDAQHYLFLADQGFRAEHITTAFYPLFPLLIRWTDLLLPGDSLIAALLLSMAFTLMGLLFLFRFVRKGFGERAALWTCLLVLAFPAGFYFGLAYTESLFLFLAAAFFYHRSEGRVGAASVFAFLLPLCRPTGILVLAPLTLPLIWDRKGWQKQVLPALAALGGFLAYLLYMKATCGSPWAGFEAQGFFRTGHLRVLTVDPLEWWSRNFLTVDYTFCGYRTSLLDRLAFLAFLLSLPWAWKGLPRDLFFFALALGTVSALSLDLVSYLRYLGVIFPFFLLLALRLRERSWALALPFAVLQVVLAVRHALDHWVA